MIQKFSTKPRFIKVKDVNKTIIRLFYLLPHKNSDVVSKIIMKRILSSCNSIYTNTTDFKRNIKDLLIMDYDVSSQTIGNVCVIVFRLVIPKSSLIDDFSLENSIKFFYESIYKPFTNNNSFDEEHFKWEKDFLLEREKDYPNSINQFAADTFEDFYDEKRNQDIHYDEYINNLKTITNKDVYKFYKKSIINNNFICYIYGNLDDKKNIASIFNKYFKQDKKLFSFDCNFYKFQKLIEYKEKKIKTKYNQSVVNLYYQVDNMKEDDVLLLTTLYYFLASRENDLIYEVLRNKHNLIYNSYVTHSNIYASLIIRVFFSIEDLKTIIDLINDTFEMIKKEDNFNLYKNRLIKALEYDILSQKDDLFNAPNDKISKYITNYDSLSDKLKFVKKLSLNDMVKFLDRIKLTRKMIMVAGDMHE
ncbi:MAG: insulinase family protein [Bacilli bacterium]|nr:insulinase family protein [Bacilli bacterium]